MLTIEPINMHWLAEMPAEGDLCVHGGIVIRHAEAILIDDSEEVWTLSAGALFLLRTLNRDHTAGSRVAAHLFPCCGHAMYAQTDSDDVAIVGCPNGRDWEVVHHGTEVRLRFDDETEVVVSRNEWREGVVAFSQVIRTFYERNATKKPADDTDAAGFAAFRAEWSRRLQAASHAA
jgi:hypothetical protein